MSVLDYMYPQCPVLHMAQINVWWMGVQWVCQSYFCKMIVSKELIQPFISVGQVYPYLKRRE